MPDKAAFVSSVLLCVQRYRGNRYFTPPKAAPSDKEWICIFIQTNAKRPTSGRAICLCFMLTSTWNGLGFILKWLVSMIQSRLFLLRDNGPYHTPGTMRRQPRQLFSASFSLTQLPFSHPAPRCLSSKCICAHLCAHGHAGLKTRCVQSHCWRVAILRNWNRLRHWPTKTWSKVNGALFVFFVFKERVNMHL